MTPESKHELEKQIEETAKVTGSLRRERQALDQLSAKLTKVHLTLSLALIYAQNMNITLSKVPLK